MFSSLFYGGKMENLSTIIMGIATIISALSAFFATVIKSKKDLEETLPTKIKKQCAVDIEITDKMEYLKEYLVADRIQIYDFHNGGHYANGRSALKTTCTFEVVRSGIIAHQKDLQAVPLSCIPKFIQKLLSENKLKINDLEEIKETMPATYELKKAQNVVSFFDVILNNKNGEPIGFLAIQYSRKNCVNFNANEKNEIYRLKYFIEENLEKMVGKEKQK